MVSATLCLSIFEWWFPDEILPCLFAFTAGIQFFRSFAPYDGGTPEEIVCSSGDDWISWFANKVLRPFATLCIVVTNGEYPPEFASFQGLNGFAAIGTQCAASEPRGLNYYTPFPVGMPLSASATHSLNF